MSRFRTAISIFRCADALLSGGLARCEKITRHPGRHRNVSLSDVVAAYRTKNRPQPSTNREQVRLGGVPAQATDRRTVRRNAYATDTFRPELGRHSRDPIRHSPFERLQTSCGKYAVSSNPATFNQHVLEQHLRQFCNMLRYDRNKMKIGILPEKSRRNQTIFVTARAIVPTGRDRRDGSSRYGRRNRGSREYPPTSAPQFLRHRQHHRQSDRGRFRHRRGREW